MSIFSKFSDEFNNVQVEKEQDFLEQLRNHYEYRTSFSIYGKAYAILNHEHFMPCSVPGIKFRFDYHGGFGVPVEGQVLIEPTWMSIWAAAERAVKISGDEHHSFLEDVRFSYIDNKCLDNEVMVFELILGS